MRGFVIGLLIGAAAGLAVGLTVSDGDADSLGAPSSAATSAQGKPPIGEGRLPIGQGRPPIESAAVRPRVDASTPSPADPRATHEHSAARSARETLIEEIRQAESHSDWARVSNLLQRAKSTGSDEDLPDDVLERLVTTPEGLELTLVMGWPQYVKEFALAHVARTPAGQRHPLREQAFLLASSLRNSGDGDSDLVLALMGHGDPRLREAGIELSPIHEFDSVELFAHIASQDDHPGVQRRAITALRSRADVDDDAKTALGTSVAHILSSPGSDSSVRTLAVESLYAVGQEVVPAAISMLREGGAPAEVEEMLVMRIVELGAGRQILDVEISPAGDLAFLLAVCNSDDPDRELLRALRPRVHATASLDDFADSDILYSYAVIGDTEIARTIVRDEALPPAARVSAAIEVAFLDARADEGLALATELAAVETQSVAVRRKLAERLEDLLDAQFAAQPAARALAERIEARDPSYWVRAAATRSLSVVRD